VDALHRLVADRIIPALETQGASGRS
jgi:hypothetical protein